MGVACRVVSWRVVSAILFLRLCATMNFFDDKTGEPQTEGIAPFRDDVAEAHALWDLIGDPFSQQSLSCDILCSGTMLSQSLATGGSVALSLRRDLFCRSCDGSGASAGSPVEKCQRCDGRGQIFENQGFFRTSRTCPDCRGRCDVATHLCSACRGAGLTTVTIRRRVSLPPQLGPIAVIKLVDLGHHRRSNEAPGHCYCLIDGNEKGSLAFESSTYVDDVEAIDIEFVDLEFVSKLFPDAINFKTPIDAFEPETSQKKSLFRRLLTWIQGPPKPKRPERSANHG